MASKEKPIYAKGKLKRNIQNINTAQSNLADAIKMISSNLNEMMKGDAYGPYWNGAKAKKFYNSAMNNISNDIYDYGKSLERLNKLAVAYEGIKD